MYTQVCQVKVYRQLCQVKVYGQVCQVKVYGQVCQVKACSVLQTMYQVNERLENENQTLLLQIQQLLNQNHDLLTTALNSKDHFAEEEKQYL